MVYLPTKLGSFKGVDKCGNPIECLGVNKYIYIYVYIKKMTGKNYSSEANRTPGPKNQTTSIFILLSLYYLCTTWCKCHTLSIQTPP